MMKMKRNIAVDETRAILIILVVFAHVISYANIDWSIRTYIVIFTVISSFHMPAFFFLSGMLINEEKWKNEILVGFLKKKMNALLIPYIFFEFLAIIYKSLILHKQSLSEGIVRMITIRCNVGANWFLPAMFIAQMLYFFYVQTNNSKIWYFIVCSCLFSMWYIPCDMQWLSTLSRGLTGFGFIFIGQRIKALYSSVDTKEKRFYQKIVISVVVVLMCSVFNYRVCSNSFYDCVMDNPIVFALGGLAGLYAVFCISSLIQWRWLCWLGENTLIIMGTHQLVLYTIPASVSPFWVIGVMAVIFIIEIPLIYITEQYCPMLVGKARK